MAHGLNVIHFGHPSPLRPDYLSEKEDGNKVRRMRVLFFFKKKMVNYSNNFQRRALNDAVHLSLANSRTKGTFWNRRAV